MRRYSLWHRLRAGLVGATVFLLSSCGSGNDEAQIQLVWWECWCTGSCCEPAGCGAWDGGQNFCGKDILSSLEAENQAEGACEEDLDWCTSSSCICYDCSPTERTCQHDSSCNIKCGSLCCKKGEICSNDTCCTEEYPIGCGDFCCEPDSVCSGDVCCPSGFPFDCGDGFCAKTPEDC